MQVEALLDIFEVPALYKSSVCNYHLKHSLNFRSYSIANRNPMHYSEHRVRLQNFLSC